MKNKNRKMYINGASTYFIDSKTVSQNQSCLESLFQVLCCT